MRSAFCGEMSPSFLYDEDNFTIVKWSSEHNSAEVENISEIFKNSEIFFLTFKKRLFTILLLMSIMLLFANRLWNHLEVSMEITDILIYITEWIGTIAFSVSGAIHAIGKKLDLLGRILL